MSDVCGYVHRVSPSKKTRNSSEPYFLFKLQTNNDDFHHAYCFDATKKAMLEGFQASHTAVKLRNIQRKQRRNDPDHVDLIMTKRTKMESASNTEAPFDFNAILEEDAVAVPIQDLHTIEPGQLVSVTARISMQRESIRTVVIGDQAMQCLDKAVLTDNSGSFPCTLWGDLINELNTGTSYTLTNLRVKTYRGSKKVTSTPSTSWTPSEELFPDPTEDDVAALLNMRTAVNVTIHTTQDFRRWLSCVRCRKVLTDVTTHRLLTCNNCRVVQRPSSCTTKAMIKLTIVDDDQEITLTAFEAILQQLLMKYNSDQEHAADSPITTKSPDDDIYLAVLGLPRMNIQFKQDTKVIEFVTFI